MFEQDTGCPGLQSNGYPQESVKQDRLHREVQSGLPIDQPAPDFSGLNKKVSGLHAPYLSRR
jgi:hypothetical protein